MKHEVSSIEPLSVAPSLEGRVTNELRRLIVQGGIPQGTKLVQRQIARQFRVSPTPIRSAWIQLGSEHLISIDENGHGRVTYLTAEDFQEVFAARSGVEGLAARLGAEAISDAGIAEMRAHFEELKEHASHMERMLYLKVRWLFHEVAYKAAGRERLLQEVERLYWRSERYNHLLLKDEHSFEESLGHYRRLLEACERRDGSAAEAVIISSIRWGVEALLGQLPSERDFDAEEG